MKIWKRYLLGRIGKTFLFILACILAGYILVDLSINGFRFFSKGTTTFADIALYYLRQFAMHLELFLPLSFLLAALKVLFDLNSHRELVALQMAGLSKKKLLSPFFLFAGILTLASYINSQWFAPTAQEAVYAFRESHPKGKTKTKREHVFTLSLDDDSELVYQNFDEKKKELFDVFWIRSPDDIWHMKILNFDSKPPQGRFADRLIRTKEKQFIKLESHETIALPDLRWDEDAIVHKFVPFENRPISHLLVQACYDNADRQRISSHLHYKFALPLLPFLVIIGISPVSMRFARRHPTFLITACSLFAFVSLMTVLDGMLILGENLVLPSYIAIWSPIAAVFALTIRSFAKL